MNGLDAIAFEDAERLEEWLSANELTPYVDFEILTVTLSDAAVEVDPKGNPGRIARLLEDFGARYGYDVLPVDPDTGIVSLRKHYKRQG